MPLNVWLMKESGSQERLSASTIRARKSWKISMGPTRKYKGYSKPVWSLVWSLGRLVWQSYGINIQIVMGVASLASHGSGVEQQNTGSCESRISALLQQEGVRTMVSLLPGLVCQKHSFYLKCTRQTAWWHGKLPTCGSALPTDRDEERPSPCLLMCTTTAMLLLISTMEWSITGSWKACRACSATCISKNICRWGSSSVHTPEAPPFFQCIWEQKHLCSGEF